MSELTVTLKLIGNWLTTCGPAAVVLQTVTNHSGASPAPNSGSNLTSGHQYEGVLTCKARSSSKCSRQELHLTCMPSI